ncbi:TetR/AcrR family transcriptional regulator [Blastococcus sp. TBT05-19]|uniref:TetR/AcrR family transcriptional regulator n=1 Tax=Blastococcus sp. TBT05-19 TaxID=2250581 RepID=UPI000DE8B0C2|nr:TetR/AcrR family transcriptional regulator [Blastococcus sp. TBT05-19]RBY89136.1 TetR/AcrR family transcriptional regulator [Blastococcus sp. TBT05-19]
MTTAGTARRGPGRPGGSTGGELLEIARQAFLAQGFAGTTMDAVAARARISKQTLYRQYASKDDLFAAVVRDWVDRGHDAMRPHTQALLDAPSVREGLLRLAGTLQAGVLSAPVRQMRTLVAAEAESFPEVAADYVARSWDRNQRLLAGALAELAARGALTIGAPDVAAEQFTWLVLGAPLNRLTLQAGAPAYDEEALATVAREAVDTFLSRFGR